MSPKSYIPSPVMLYIYIHWTFSSFSKKRLTVNRNTKFFHFIWIKDGLFHAKFSLFAFRVPKEKQNAWGNFSRCCSLIPHGIYSPLLRSHSVYICLWWDNYFYQIIVLKNIKKKHAVGNQRDTSDGARCNVKR